MYRLSLDSDIVLGLEHDHVITRVAYAEPFGIWSYRIQQWAWDYLIAHPDLLT